jgi:glutamate synthase domain-containing protein 2
VQGSYGNQGATILILSDVLAGPDRLPIPSLLALGAVHQHLLKTGQRGKAALFVDAGDMKDVHDMALILGFGADGVCPRVAYEALLKLREDGLIAARMRNQLASPDDAPSDAEIRANYRNALAKGLLKVFSKMGISTLQSYKGAQIFEALGLHADVVETCFSGTPSRIGGASFAAIQRDVVQLHDHAWGNQGSEKDWTGVDRDNVPQLPNPGQFHYRHLAETHLNTPQGMVHLQTSTKLNSEDIFRQYCRDADAQNDASTLRGILRWRPDALDKGAKAGVSLDDVEPAKEIVKRFVTGAMSLGSISALRRRPPLGHQAGRVRPLRRDVPLPRQLGPDPDQDGAGSETR